MLFFGCKPKATALLPIQVKLRLNSSSDSMMDIGHTSETDYQKMAFLYPLVFDWMEINLNTDLHSIIRMGRDKIIGEVQHSLQERSQLFNSIKFLMNNYTILRS